MAADTSTRRRSTRRLAHGCSTEAPVRCPVAAAARTLGGPPHRLTKESPSMDTYVTMQGNLVADPTRTVTASGQRLTKFRIAASGRRFDGPSQEWVNTNPVYMTVSCWRQLGDNVFQTLYKGDTVV